MPFDFEAYRAKCENLSEEQLHLEWQSYTRQVYGGVTSTATAVVFTPYTAGLSLVGIGFSAPRIHNARKKRAIIKANLHSQGKEPVTRMRDVVVPMAISGAANGTLLACAGSGADLIAADTVGIAGAKHAASHIAAEVATAAFEHRYIGQLRKKASQKMSLLCQNCQHKHLEEKAALGTLQPQYQTPDYPLTQQNALDSQDQYPPQMPLVNNGFQGYQPLPPSQDHKCEFSPVPLPQVNTPSYQIESDQQTSPGSPQTNSYQSLPPYHSIQNDEDANGSMPTSPPQSNSSVGLQHMRHGDYTSPCPNTLSEHARTPLIHQDLEARSQPISHIKRKPVPVRTVSDNSDHKSVTTDPPM